ncbi:MAG: hypothetical protein A3G33_00380 [Omnitrophica bacterium RIFCSPLOWO2_12_FULL_44_17]|uniref:Ig-like domain-containing protein n=1 Tax=Candidatus Danuiimicrobium aquiferis TaxID=1801832 RepID=A0A1G1KV86_9BACT|nr:MAG: hypothetical protein A3G33_00380 [Omnitrophica bacterium RIFCSPLOWO2_12_FULL_44_17]
MVGSATSNDGVLNVNDAPAITTQPVNVTTNPGTNATFTVAASGTAPLSYQWRKGTSPLYNAGKYSGVTTTTLTITGVADAEEGNYNCEVSNMAGSATSDNGVLTVNDAPVITTQPISQTKNLGENASFTVAASGTAPLSYQWRKGTSPLSDTGKFSGVTTTTLTISDVADAEEGNYNCVVSNMVGSATSDDASLTVRDVAPVITTQPVSQTKNPGENATFTVAASGTAPLSYQWSEGTSPLSNGGKYSGVTTTTLTITGVADAEEGNYNCVVSNVAGSATSDNASLTINDAPVITTQPVSQIKNLGETATFTVAASGTAPLSYQWRKGTSPLSNAGKYSGVTTTTLTITSVAATEEGNYNCVVTNMAGTATSNDASLTIGASFTLSGTKNDKDGGSVISTPSGISCGIGCQTYSASFGGSVLLTATPDTGASYQFIKWTGDSECNDSVQQLTNPITIAMSANKTCNAVFDRAPTANIEVRTIPDGAVTPGGTPPMPEITERVDYVLKSNALDPDVGDILTYVWEATAPTGTQANILDTLPDPKSRLFNVITPPSTTSEVVVKVTVTDSYGLSTISQLSIRALNFTAPVAREIGICMPAVSTQWRYFAPQKNSYDQDTLNLTGIYLLTTFQNGNPAWIFPTDGVAKHGNAAKENQQAKFWADSSTWKTGLEDDYERGLYTIYRTPDTSITASARFFIRLYLASAPIDYCGPVPGSTKLGPNTGEWYFLADTKNFRRDLSVRGTIMAPDGIPLSGVIVDGGPLGEKVTGADGTFLFQNVNYGLNYTITPSKDEYCFTSQSRTAYVVPPGEEIHSFTATAGSCS